MQLYNIATSFTRPADAAQYAIGDLVANSTTAGSVVPMTFALGNSFAVAQTRITRVRISKTGTSATSANFRLHLYQASPTVANGDNGVWSTDNAANYLGSIDVASMKAFTDGCCDVGAATAGSEFMIRTASGKNLYGLLEARATYTPANAEVFTVTLEELETY